MNYKKVAKADLAFFKTILDEKYIIVQADRLSEFASDHTEDLYYLPELVIQPDNNEQISKIVKYCNENIIPITVRGAGTGLSGGALAIYGGLVLDMCRMNKIIFLDEENFQITVEPGVITEELQNLVKNKGMFYPPDPASKGSCFIGGNVAENSGGPKAVKYGVVKDYVLNLEIVLADGSIIWTGANVLKNATGYNLTALLVGSEGTLGIITKIVLKLIPYPQKDVLLLVPFKNSVEACKAVNSIFLAGITPSAIEFMERDAIDCAIDYYNESSLNIGADINAHLLIELDGNDSDILYKEAEKISELLEKFDVGEILFADTKEQKDTLWKLRRIVGIAVKGNSVYKEEDTVVPRAALPKLLSRVKEIGNEFGFRSVCYGHAGDGNLHVNIVKDKMSDDEWTQKLPLGIVEIFKEVALLGGTISGEHGIGCVQKEYMNIVFNDAQLYYMKAIKQIFDPKNIFNPGKIFP